MGLGGRPRRTGRNYFCVGGGENGTSVLAGLKASLEGPHFKWSRVEWGRGVEGRK